MYCSKCGKKLIENSKFCFNCGTKINSPMEKKLVSKKTDVKKSFKLGENNIVFNSNEIKEILIRSIFERNASLCTLYFKSFGKYEIKEFEELYGKLYDLYKNLIEQNLEIATKILFEFDIFTYDKNEIEKILPEYCEIEEGLEEYYEDLRMIEDKIKEFNKEKLQRSNQTGPWKGGGFGIRGAIKGAIKAGVLNAGHHLIGKVEDCLINTLDKGELIRIKKECLVNGDALDSLNGVMYDVICSIGEIVCDILVEEKIIEENNWWAPEKSYAQRNNLVNLYNKKEKDSKFIKMKMCECFQKDSFSVYVLRDMCKINISVEGDVQNLCEFMGYEKDFIAQEIFGLEINYSEAFYNSFYNKKPPHLMLDNGTKQIGLIKSNLENMEDIIKDGYKFPTQKYYKVTLFEKTFDLIISDVVATAGKQSKLTSLISTFRCMVKEILVYMDYEVMDAINYSYKYMSKVQDNIQKNTDWDIFKTIVSEYIKILKNMSKDMLNSNDYKTRFDNLCELNSMFNE